MVGQHSKGQSGLRSYFPTRKNKKKIKKIKKNCLDCGMAILRVGVGSLGDAFVVFVEDVTRIVRAMAAELPHPTHGAVLVVAAEGESTTEMTVEWPIDAGADERRLRGMLRGICDGRMSYCEVALHTDPGTRTLHPVAKLDLRVMELRTITEGDPGRPPPREAIRELAIDLVLPPRDLSTWAEVGRVLKAVSGANLDIFIAYTQKLGGSAAENVAACTQEWRAVRGPASRDRRRRENSWMVLKDSAARATPEHREAYIAWCRLHGFLP
jgi:hypothetical protein